jgi:hypothetical protein
VRKSSSLVRVLLNLSGSGIFSDLLETVAVGGGGGAGGGVRGGDGPPNGSGGSGLPSGASGLGACCNKASWAQRVVTVPSGTTISSCSSPMCCLASLRA